MLKLVSSKRQKKSGIWSQEFQDQFLAKIVRDKSMVDRCREIIDSDDFDSEHRSSLVSTVLDYYDEYKGLPTKNILRDLIKSNFGSESQRPMLRLVEQIYSEPISEFDEKYIEEKVVISARASAAKRALVRCVDLLREEKLDEIGPIIQSAMMVGQGIGDLGVSLKKDGLKFLRTDFNDKIKTIDLGYPNLSRAMGAAEAGELMTIMAPPNIGKTMVLQNLSVGAWLKGHNVMHYSFELGEKKSILRYLARVAKINYKELVDKVDDVRRSIHIINKVTKADLCFKFFPQKSIGVVGLRGHILQLIANDFRPDVVTVDYGALLKPASVRKEKREELSEIFTDLRGLAGELEVFVLTANQSRRSSLHRKIIDMNDVAEDWGIMMIADVAAAICQVPEENELKLLRIFIAKTRGEERARQAYFSVDYSKLWLKETTKHRYFARLPRTVRDKYGFAEEFSDNGHANRETPSGSNDTTIEVGDLGD